MRLLLDPQPLSGAYRSAKPFPHIQLDGLLPVDYLESLLREFPKPEENHWRHIESAAQIKFTTRTDQTLSPALRQLLFWLNSSDMIDWLETLTGIKGLLPDPHFDGAGPHMIASGGKLGLHADYNWNRRLQLHRRLNLLIYLNPDWKEEYGGHLELWEAKVEGKRVTPAVCRQKILPVFGRVVVFDTTDFTLHGHPDPLQCPAGQYRRSIAMYYFSRERPAEETWVPTAGQHTLFYPRPGSQDVEEQAAIKSYLRTVPGWAQKIVRRVRG